MDDDKPEDKQNADQKSESSAPYVLYEYTTEGEERFIQYYDLKNRYKFHDQVFQPDYFKDRSDEGIAAWMGWKRLYSCEAIVPKGQLVKAWAQGDSQTPITYTIDPYQARFRNFKGLIPPETVWKPGQKERYDQAETIYNSGHYSYQGILDLYDPAQDNDNTYWLVIMGLAYSNPRDSFYDEKKAYDFYVKASNLGSETAAFNLGVNWRDGYFGKIDLEKAEKWFTKALDEGDANAGTALFEMLKKDKRYKSDPDFTNAADAIFQRAIDIGSLWVTYDQARYQLNGQWGYRNPIKGIELYDSLAANQPIDKRQYVLAIYRLAQRYYLGTDVYRNVRKGLSYLDMIPTDKGDNIVMPSVKTSVEKLRHMIEAELNPVLSAPQDNIRDVLPYASAAIAGSSHLIWTGRYDVAALVWVAVAFPSLLKAIAAKSDKAVRYTASTLSALGTGFCAYAIAAHKMSIDGVVSQLWEHRVDSAIGFGAAAGSAALVRAWAQEGLTFGNVVKSVAGIAVAGGLYFGGFLSLPKTVTHESPRVITRVDASANSDTKPVNTPVIEYADNNENTYVIAKRVNVRTKDGTKVGTLVCGDEVRPVRRLNTQWTEINLPNVSPAYVASRYLSHTWPTAQQCHL